MSKRCPDCGWPYLEDTEYTRHLVKGHCKVMTNSGGKEPGNRYIDPSSEEGLKMSDDELYEHNHAVLQAINSRPQPEPPQGELEEQLERLFWVAMQAEATAVATIGRGITPAFHTAAKALIAQREKEAYQRGREDTLRIVHNQLAELEQNINAHPNTTGDK